MTPLKEFTSTIVLLFFIFASELNAQTINEKSLPQKLIEAAQAQIGITLYYDPSYQKIDYPNGDVPKDRGVCTDVVIRAFRSLNFDLQQLVHEDMSKNFAAYPTNWGLKRTDSNIDHRRVPNLQTFFTRKGKSLKVSSKSEDYIAGDIVTWNLPSGVPHVGIVSNKKVEPNSPRMIIHNIGSGTQIEDILFKYQITGHYRYFK